MASFKVIAEDEAPAPPVTGDQSTNATMEVEEQALPAPVAQVPNLLQSATGAVAEREQQPRHTDHARTTWGGNACFGSSAAPQLLYAEMALSMSMAFVRFLYATSLLHLWPLWLLDPAGQPSAGDRKGDSRAA